MIETRSYIIQQHDSQDSESPQESADKWGGQTSSDDEINQQSMSDFDLTGQAIM